MAGPMMKPETERGPHQSEGVRALLVRGDVGDVGVGDDIGRAANPGDGAADEQPNERRRQREDDVIDGKSEHGQQQQWAAAIGVREVAEQGTGEELHRREDDEHPSADDGGIGDADTADIADQRRHDRDDQAEADHVEHHGDENEYHGTPRRRVHPRRRRLCHGDLCHGNPVVSSRCHVRVLPGWFKASAISA